MKAYLRSLSEEFGESTNAVRVELNRLTKAGLLISEKSSNTIVYSANKDNTLFSDIHNLVKKYLGIDIVEEVINKLGNVEAAYITGDYAKGEDSGIIDLVIIGNIKKKYLNELVTIAEENIKRKIRLLILKSEEFPIYSDKLKLERAIVVWKKTIKDEKN